MKQELQDQYQSVVSAQYVPMVVLDVATARRKCYTRLCFPHPALSAGSMRCIERR